MNSKFLGTGVALITPFTSDLSIDYNALKHIVEFNIENGVEYLVISGTTAESVTITKQEKQDITNAIIDVTAGRVP
jgi:4-hydroxy-tetrahydrodipicolinate synthase